MPNGRETNESEPVILVVEDEPDLADLYSTWLASEYTVRTAYSGEGARELLDDRIDVALIDRKLPDLSGDELLREMRERGIDCRIALVTGVAPDFDIIELGFDDYLVKPVAVDQLDELVTRLLRRSTYDDRLQEYFALVSKRAVLEAEKSDEELAASDAYAELEREIDDASERLDTIVAELDDEDFLSLFQTVGDGPIESDS